MHKELIMQSYSKIHSVSDLCQTLQDALSDFDVLQKEKEYTKDKFEICNHTQRELLGALIDCLKDYNKEN